MPKLPDSFRCSIEIPAHAIESWAAARKARAEWMESTTGSDLSLAAFEKYEVCVRAFYHDCDMLMQFALCHRFGEIGAYDLIDAIDMEGKAAALQEGE